MIDLRSSLLLAICVGAMQIHGVYAASPVDTALDPTMTVIESGATPADIINLIALPPRPPRDGEADAGSGSRSGNAQSGQETSAAAQAQGPGFGRQVVEEARQGGQDTSADARAAAQALAEEARSLGRQMADEAARNDLGERIREERARDAERGGPPDAGPGARPGS
ncbi:MAG: hypothetical protein KF911_07035 [Pseudomonadales bacterium]|nr:hypothetical protein [Pseudomonadales bacterium]